MSNSLKNDLILLNELQDLDCQIIEAQKKVDEVKNTHDFLMSRVSACDFILSEIERMNVVDKISFENIKNLVCDQNFCWNDIINEGDSVDVCVSKIKEVKSKFENKITEIEAELKASVKNCTTVVNKIDNQKKSVVSIIQKNILKVYNRLSDCFDDKIVVTTIVDNTCAHCHVKNCAQKTIDVLKFENLVFCENCGRIFCIV